MEQRVVGTPSVTSRRRFVRRRQRSTDAALVASPARAGSPASLQVSVRQDGSGAAIVTVAGLLVRQHARSIDVELALAFGGRRERYVIDLAGVTCLDPTTLAAVTGYARRARREGALVVIVPPGARRPSAA